MIEVQDLTRRFGDHTAVDHVSFAVPRGQLIGFVGGNGAGKTTTMRMIMGLLQIHEGEVRWDGHEVTTADRRTFGYMPEERPLPQAGDRRPARLPRSAARDVAPGRPAGDGPAPRAVRPR